uniref:methyl-accepting chemotaxis protein n=1 Tax=Azohydromonas lata TaxID=45677 RepID=UPI000B1B5122
GFAVVAGEVRTLAQRSAEAAKEIKQLITESVQSVGEGSALADQAGHTMEEVVSAIRRVTDLMGEISAASAEQSKGVSLVGDAVTRMDQATQQNAALVEQSASAAGSLREQAQALVGSVAVFRLGAQADSGRPAPVAARAQATADARSPAPAAAQPATGSGWDGVERRGPHRATNVTRPDFRRAAPAMAAAAVTPLAQARTGTDDEEWAAF